MKFDQGDQRLKNPWLIREDGLGWVEKPVKMVGRFRPMSPKAALQWNNSMLKLSPLCGRWFPKGVFRFKTWTEEIEWTRIQIEAAMKRLK